jgi:hypothetical protein
MHGSPPPLGCARVSRPRTATTKGLRARPAFRHSLTYDTAARDIALMIAGQNCGKSSGLRLEMPVNSDYKTNEMPAA